MNSKEIRELRKKLKMSPLEFARKVNVAPITVKRWEGGTNKPSPLAQRVLARLARRVKQ